MNRMNSLVCLKKRKRFQGICLVSITNITVTDITNRNKQKSGIKTKSYRNARQIMFYSLFLIINNRKEHKVLSKMCKVNLSIKGAKHSTVASAQWNALCTDKLNLARCNWILIVMHSTVIHICCSDGSREIQLNPISSADRYFIPSRHLCLPSADSKCVTLLSSTDTQMMSLNLGNIDRVKW